MWVTRLRRRTGGRGGSRTLTPKDRHLKPACLPFHHAPGRARLRRRGFLLAADLAEGGERRRRRRRARTVAHGDDRRLALQVAGGAADGAGLGLGRFGDGVPE